MQRKLLIAFAFLFTMASAFAQRVLLDFETESQEVGLCFGTGGADDDSCFNAIANPDASGVNTSATVGEYIEPAGGEPWMGMFFNVVNGGDVDLTTATGDTRICADVWVPTAVPFTIKVEQVDGGGTAVAEYEAPGITPSVTGAWETVCADMDAFNNTANRLVFFFNIGAIPAAPTTYYFDNVIQTDVSSVGGLIAEKGLKFYPNPATHNLYFNADGTPMTVTIADLSGRQLLRYNGFTGNNVRVSDLPSGVYTITFVDETTGQFGSAKFSKI